MPAANEPFLPVNELFQTMQGEAIYTGTPAVFVRLQGCDVGCPWCDTKHTWAIDPAHEAPAAEVLAKDEKASPRWARLSAAELAAAIAQYPARHVVITGGEPCVHDLTELCTTLRALDRQVQIETSGTQPIRASNGAWVTLSPKIDMPGGFQVLREAVLRANEIKMPVGKMEDVERLAAFLAEHGELYVPVWLQPLSRSPKATALCIEQATLRGWKVSVQTHAFIGVR